jgi:hypothetical protein
MVSVTARVVRTIEAVISPSGYPSNSRSSEKKQACCIPSRPILLLATVCIYFFGEASAVGGMNNFRRTFHVTLLPGSSVTMPVFIPCHSLPNGSEKLNCSSIAVYDLVGGA